LVALVTRSRPNVFAMAGRHLGEPDFHKYSMTKKGEDSENSDNEKAD
jgi:hypothetical protein